MTLTKLSNASNLSLACYVSYRKVERHLEFTQEERRVERRIGEPYISTVTGCYSTRNVGKVGPGRIAFDVSELRI
jgi:hypothetical protein